MILYPYKISLLHNARQYEDWLYEREIRFAFHISDFDVDEIRFKYAEDLLAFKLRFGI
jgi:hypothetical protein